MDPLMINEVRNLVYANLQGENGQDLLSLDIERARDHGIGSYNQVREAFGLAPVTSFAQITSNATVQQELQEAYGSVDNIDPFVGGMAENLAPGAAVGPTFKAIMADQFERLREGDRYFYLNEQWNSAEQALLKQGNTLTKVIEANTGITNLQPDVFKFTASIGGTVSLAQSRNSQPQGVAGVTVQLQDTSGDVLATTITNRYGNYTFTQLSGPSVNPEIASGVSATGDYDIVLVLPQNLQQVSPNPGPIHISRGGLNINNVNFKVQFDSPSFSIGLSSTAPATSTLTASPTGGAAVIGSSSTETAAASVDATQTATIAMALADSTGSASAATPQTSAPSRQASGTGSTSSVSSSVPNQNTIVFIAKRGPGIADRVTSRLFAWDQA
jgi:hypothetical protein